MSHGRSEDTLTPLGGAERSEGGAHLSVSHGRSEDTLTPRLAPGIAGALAALLVAAPAAAARSPAPQSFGATPVQLARAPQASAAACAGARAGNPRTGACGPLLQPRPSIEGGRMHVPPPPSRCVDCGTVSSVAQLRTDAAPERAGARTRYRVEVRMDDGSVRSATLSTPPPVGTRVRVDRAGRIEAAR